MKNYTSIIMVTHVINSEREVLFFKSLNSLIETTKNLPVEIIIVDMGENKTISTVLNNYVEKRLIQTYIHNSTNMSFGIGRNQGFACAYGDYIAIVDNDIYFYDGWLESCISILEKHPKRKLYSSPIEYPTGLLKEKYDQGHLDGYNLNMRAGSNCFVIKRKDYLKIGNFKPHRIAGTKWTDRAVKLGYLCAVAPTYLAEDMGLRSTSAYNHTEPAPLKRTLTNGIEVHLNQDEFNDRNPNLIYQKI